MKLFLQIFTIYALGSLALCLFWAWVGIPLSMDLILFLAVFDAAGALYTVHRIGQDRKEREKAWDDLEQAYREHHRTHPPKYY